MWGLEQHRGSVSNFYSSLIEFSVLFCFFYSNNNHLKIRLAFYFFFYFFGLTGWHAEILVP